MSTPRITVEEGLELARLEGVIQQGEDVLLQVIGAYIEIRDRRLYRAQFQNFEQYCQQRWGRTQGRINQLIRAHEAIEGLPPGVDTMVSTERAARELATVPQAQRAEIVTRAAQNGRATGRSIREAAREVRGQPTVEMDGTGHPIPHALVALWARRKEVDATLTHLSRLRTMLAQAQADSDPLWAEVSFQSAVGSIDQAYAALKATKPYAVCMRCQGHPETQSGGCRLCKGRGLIGEFRYRTVPEEERAMRERNNT